MTAQFRSKSEQFFAEHGEELFRYDPGTGNLWRLMPPASLFASEHQRKCWLVKADFSNPADINQTTGYRQVTFCGRRVLAHRMAWRLKTGVWPHGIIDHIDGDGRNNRWSNLRLGDESLNRMNQRCRSDNRSGVPGVYFDSKRSKWLAQICVRGKRQQLGAFTSRDEAVAVRLSAQAAHDFGPNHGARS